MQNNAAPSPAVPNLTPESLQNGYRLGQGSPISCRTGGPSTTGGAFTDLLVSEFREKKQRKSAGMLNRCPCDIYSADKELRNAQSPPMQSPWEKRKKATIKTVKLICSSVMQLPAPIPK